MTWGIKEQRNWERQILSLVNWGMKTLEREVIPESNDFWRTKYEQDSDWGNEKNIQNDSFEEYQTWRTSIFDKTFSFLNIKHFQSVFNCCNYFILVILLVSDRWKTLLVFGYVFIILFVFVFDRFHFTNYFGVAVCLFLSLNDFLFLVILFMFFKIVLL